MVGRLLGFLAPLLWSVGGAGEARASGHCKVVGYYYGGDYLLEAPSPSWQTCQEICRHNSLCYHFSFWPDGGCVLEGLNATLRNSEAACDEWVAKRAAKGYGSTKNCSGDFVLSGPRLCGKPFAVLYPDLSPIPEEAPVPEVQPKAPPLPTLAPLNISYVLQAAPPLPTISPLHLPMAQVSDAADDASDASVMGAELGATKSAGGFPWGLFVGAMVVASVGGGLCAAGALCGWRPERSKKSRGVMNLKQEKVDTMLDLEAQRLLPEARPTLVDPAPAAAKPAPTPAPPPAPTSAPTPGATSSIGDQVCYKSPVVVAPAVYVLPKAPPTPVDPAPAAAKPAPTPAPPPAPASAPTPGATSSKSPVVVAPAVHALPEAPLVCVEPVTAAAKLAHTPAPSPAPMPGATSPSVGDQVCDKSPVVVAPAVHVKVQKP